MEVIDKKQIRVIFLFEFKISHKAVETTRNISNTFGSGTADECTVQWLLKKIFKGDESLENEVCRGWPSEVDSNPTECISEADPLRTT